MGKINLSLSIPTSSMKKAFVLSGGAARGFAHLGVAKALYEYGIYPSAISGTSAGAIAGAFLANGYTPDEIIEMLDGKLTRKMLTWHSIRHGLVSFKKIKAYLEENLRYKTFEELPIPLYVTATSYVDGRQKIFNEGNILDAIEASCAIPAIFPSVEIDSVVYVDGGLANNLPVEPFIDRRNEIIAVHVNPIRDLNPKRGLWETIDRSFHLSFANTVYSSARDCFMYIEPKELVNYLLFDLNKSHEIIQAGYDYTKLYLAERTHLLKDESSFINKLKAGVKNFLKS